MLAYFLVKDIFVYQDLSGKLFLVYLKGCLLYLGRNVLVHTIFYKNIYENQFLNFMFSQNVGSLNTV
jgi:hypothetical protein